MRDRPGRAQRGLAELDRLEAALADAPDGDVPAELAERLQALLARVRTRRDVPLPAEADVVAQARTASVDDLLSFIDRELM